MKTKVFLICSFLFLVITPAIPQQQTKDKGIFVEKGKGFYNEILKALGDLKDSSGSPAKKSFKADPDNKDFPKSINEFKSYWYNEPVSQGRTGTCWSFSTTSFLESEV
ncbi:MAG: peptidase C1, partial [Ignavibacteria bacterium]